MKYKFTQLALKLMESHNLQHITTLDFTPKRGTPGSSGYDLSACLAEPLCIHPGEFVKIGTGVHIWIGSATPDVPDEMLVAGFLMPRSSTKGLLIANSIGVCDDDYQGEYMVSLHNYTDESIYVNPGQKLVQVVYVFTYVPVMENVEQFFEKTSRGTNGFGSTGR
jgi:dUTP pyrophosphatase